VIGRRAWLAGLLAMTVPGRGGQQEPPLNAPAGQATPIGIQPGTTGPVIRARQVIITSGVGSNQGVFVYNGPPAAGNLIESMSLGGTDPYRNKTVVGVAAYSNVMPTGFAVALVGGTVQFYTGSLAAGWTIAAPAGGNLAINLTSELSINFPTLQLVSVATAPIPISAAGVTTVPQVISLLQQVGIFS